MNVEGFAHDRLHSPDGIVMTLVRGELDAARGKFPDSTHQLAALMEEVGELAQALMEHDRDGAQTIAMVLREAVQVASMAIRLATEGDANFKYVFPATEEDLPRGPVTDRF
jgi:NTP pyrophosphatase (non-canonical NTP hydrolase)